MSKPKHLPKRRTIVLSAIFVLSILLTGILTYTFAQTGTTFTLSSGIYPSASDYTVYKVGTTYYAKDKCGVVTYSSTDANIVLNATFALGGYIYISPGTYSGIDRLVPLASIHIAGKPNETVLVSTQTRTGYRSMISNVYGYDMVVDGLTLDGGGATVNYATYGISSWGGETVIRNCHVYDCYGNGLEGHTSNYTFSLFKCVDNIIERCGGNAATGKAIMVGYSAGDTFTKITYVDLNHNVIKDIYEHGIKVYETTTDYASITDNKIDNCNGAGISCLVRAIIANNWITNVSNTALSSISVNSERCIISGNYVIDFGGDGIDCSGDNNTIIGNQVLSNITGYVGATHHGIVLDGLNNVLCGNTVCDAAGNGIYLLAGSNFTSISGGVMQNIGTYGIRVASSFYCTVSAMTLYSVNKCFYESGSSNYNGAVNCMLISDYGASAVGIAGANSYVNSTQTIHGGTTTFFP